MAKKVFLIAAIVLVFLIGRVAFKVTQVSGHFEEFDTILADRCQTIEIAPGPEDIAIDHETGIAYIASTDRRETSVHPRGSIFSLDLNDPESKPIEILGDEPADFYTHGISLWRGPDGDFHLFAVNHPEMGETVEIFDIKENGQLQYVETIQSEAMHSLNDVVAVGPRQFYATNDQRFQSGLGSVLELFLGLPLGELIYFDGNRASNVASGFAFANSVNVSLDGKQIYVTETIGRKVVIFNREIATGKLNGRKNINIKTGADNIDVAPDGSLYIGAHPNLLAFNEHSSDPEAISPSQVVRFDPTDSRFETVYLSQNGELDSSATGAYWNNTLLVSGVFEGKLARCAM